MNIPRPAFVRSIQRMTCTACGAEANASCNCGKPYVPAAQRVKEYDEQNPGQSTRQAATDLGVNQSTVVKARRDAGASPATVTGRDGKSYPARKKAEREPESAADRAEARCAAQWRAFTAEEEAEISTEQRQADHAHRADPEHYRSALVIHAGQAADLAQMFAATLTAEPGAMTDEAMSEVGRAVKFWLAATVTILETSRKPMPDLIKHVEHTASALFKIKADLEMRMHAAKKADDLSVPDFLKRA